MGIHRTGQPPSCQFASHGGRSAVGEPGPQARAVPSGSGAQVRQRAAPGRGRLVDANLATADAGNLDAAFSRRRRALIRAATDWRIAIDDLLSGRFERTQTQMNRPEFSSRRNFMTTRTVRVLAEAAGLLRAPQRVIPLFSKLASDELR